MKKHLRTILFTFLCLTLLGFAGLNAKASSLPDDSTIVAPDLDPEIPVTPTIKLSAKTLTLCIKGTTSKSLTAATTNTEGTVKWKSSNTKIATVSSKGKVTAKKVGTATITATVDGVKATCKVTVIPKLKLSKSKATINMNSAKTLQLKASVAGTSKKVAWKSSNTKIATVSSSGKVTAKKAGKVTITATVAGAKKTCAITVTPKIKLNKTKATIVMSKSNTLKLKATVTGSSNAVKWKSSDTKIATVSSSGKVTAKKSGKVTIAAYVDGSKVKCKITVDASAPAKKGTYTKNFGGSTREVTIKKISATSVTFQIRYTSLMRLSTSNSITAKIKDNKASFSYNDIGWGGSGKGVIVFGDGYIKLKTVNKDGNPDFVSTGGNTYKLKRTSSSTKFIFY